MPSSTVVNSLCGPGASHCQYSTVAYWAQQEADVRPDPRPTRWSLDIAGRMRSKDVSLKRVARNKADAIDYVAGAFSLSVYCGSRCWRMGRLLWKSCAARLSGSYGRQAAVTWVGRNRTDSFKAESAGSCRSLGAKEQPLSGIVDDLRRRMSISAIGGSRADAARCEGIKGALINPHMRK